MRQLTISVVLVMLLASGLVPATAAQDSDGDEVRPPDGATIRLQSGVIDPTDGAPPSERRVLLVQFDGPITTEDRIRLGEAATVLGYVADGVFKVRGDAAQLATLDAVRWVGPLDPLLEVHPDISDAVGLLRVVLEPDSNGATAADLVAAAGVPARRFDTGFIILGDRSLALRLAALDSVGWVEPFVAPVTFNDGAGTIIGTPSALAAGYDGGSQIVAVADTGLGDGAADGAHRDLPAARIGAVLDYPATSLAGCYTAQPDGAQDVDSGHGTHVTGSVASDGGTGGLGRGSAPGATVVFQAIEDYVDYNGLCTPLFDDAYILGGLPSDLTDLFQDAYDLGARIHSNSWGSDAEGDYTADSAAVDQFTWDHPHFLTVFAGGNAGIDDNSNGVVDLGSIGSPATAKNALTVGASENDRGDSWPCDGSLVYVNPDTGTSCSSQAGSNVIFTWSDAWPDDFPAEPLASDAAAGNAEQMAAFSSRGPTDDGRIKPDVVAPGSWILSTFSSRYQEGYGAIVNPQNGAFQYDGWGFPIDTHYKYMGGTSMSTPLVAGAATVVRDFYETVHDHDASAALVKATLINSADDLADENNDGANDNDLPIPNEHEGWGIIDVAEATDGAHVWVDTAAVTTGSASVYGIETAGGAPLKITLVWSDYPSTASAADNLVNDIDLTVTAPDGTIYIGNNFAGGWTSSGTVPSDDTNNVENVYVQTAAAGTWSVEVRGANVPQGPQPFALVVDGGGLGDADVEPPTWPAEAEISVEALGQSSVTVSWPAADDDVGVTEYTVARDGSLVAAGLVTSATVTGLTEGVASTITVRARDAAGNLSAPLEIEVTPALDTDAPDWSGSGVAIVDIGETHVTVDWDTPVDATGVDAYLVDRTGTPTVTVDGDATSMTFGDLVPDTPYTVSVNARDPAGNTSSDGPSITFTTAPDFADTDGTTFEADIAWLAGTGITAGCDDDGNFCPGAAVSRAQMATFLTRALGLTPVDGSRFDDVTGVHAANINAVADAGITLGCTGDGSRFCPNDPVRRDQMATFLDRAFALPDSADDVFVDDDGNVHEAAINDVAKAGITLGCGIARYCPLDTVTRGQMAAFLRRALSG